MIVRRTWRSSETHRRAASAACGASLRLGQGRGEHDRLERCRARRLIQLRGRARPLQPIEQQWRRDRGAHDGLALAGRELEVVEQRAQNGLGPLLARGERQQQAREQQRLRAPVRREQRQRAARERLIEAHAGVELGQRPQLLERRQGGRRVGLGERQAQLGAEARARDAGERPALDRLGRQARCALLRRELQPAGVAREAQQARGVVDEAALVQHPQRTARQVLQRVRAPRAARPAAGRRARRRSR